MTSPSDDKACLALVARIHSDWAEDARRLLDGLSEGMRAICRGHRNDTPLQSFERAHDCLIIAATLGMAVAAHCDGRH